MPSTFRVALVGLAVVILGYLLFNSVFNSGPSPSAFSPGASQSSNPSGSQPNPPLVMPTLPLPTELAIAMGQAPVTPPPPDAAWSPVAEVSGSDSQRSPAFSLS